MSVSKRLSPVKNPFIKLIGHEKPNDTKGGHRSIVIAADGSVLIRAHHTNDRISLDFYPTWARRPTHARNCSPVGFESKSIQLLVSVVNRFVALSDSGAPLKPPKNPLF